ncbi:hypothetical protein HDU96_007465 [Phlyctochytrium bullatum]|nr:hypothetical protein HDU96_007465 [Phlyctochytrium bullatum]
MSQIRHQAPRHPDHHHRETFLPTDTTHDLAAHLGPSAFHSYDRLIETLHGRNLEPWMDTAAEPVVQWSSEETLNDDVPAPRPLLAVPYHLVAPMLPGGGTPLQPYPYTDDLEAPCTDEPLDVDAAARYAEDLAALGYNEPPEVIEKDPTPAPPPLEFVFKRGTANIPASMAHIPYEDEVVLPPPPMDAWDTPRPRARTPGLRSPSPGKPPGFFAWAAAKGILLGGNS